ncbi:hypothetical protein BCF74_1042 [Knoellia remsis]|uniref:Uncharacterized protein n=2 Tax=Knoellia remsis TaxID=407159 RepID=A0A2T0UXB6_9MICO|nr:hypothetical protein BCF74_1042 [Knoellia remsis]
MHVRGDTIPTFSHAAAAAVWRLPRVSAWPARVDVLTTKARRSSDTMRRHLGQPGMVETVDGLPVTSLTRTLIDIARTEDLKDAVAAMDHALHHALCTREQLRAELDLVPAGARGRAQAELAVSLADPGAMSVGESLSRVQMFRFNLPRPQLQVRIEDADGLAGVCDFGWVGLGTLGEFDGRKKYGLDGLEGDRVAEVMWREKKREDRIRARGHRMARWVWADAADGSRMVRILAAQGVRPTRRNTWLDAA